MIEHSLRLQQGMLPVHSVFGPDDVAVLLH